MHMPFAVLPPSAWFFAFWPAFVLLGAVLVALGTSAWMVVRRPASAANPFAGYDAIPSTYVELEGVSLSSGALIVMTGELATIPEGGPNDSLAA